jgi:hypothetical protein
MSLKIPDVLRRQPNRTMGNLPFGGWIHRLFGSTTAAYRPRHLAVASVLCLCLVIDLSGPASAEPVAYCLQIGAYRERKHAEHELMKLKKIGKNAFYRHEKIKDRGMWYKVYIERFESKGEARKEAKRLKQQQIISNYLIKALDERKEPVAAKKNVKADSRIEEPEISKTKAGISGNEKNKPQKNKPEVTKKEDPPLAIEDITFAIEKGIEEKVFIYSNRYFSPVVLFALQEERPRLVVEIKNTMTFPKGLSKIPIKGEWIEQVRIQHHPASKTLQIILDLQASENYDVTQVFNKAENIYTIKVIKKKDTKDIPPSNP